MERWFRVTEDLGNLEVSDFGRVKRHGKIYLPTARRGEYRIVVVNRKQVRFHNLIAAAFLPPRPSKRHTVDHIDRDPSNNRVDNLRWATKSEQVRNRILPRNKAGSRPVEVNFGTGWIRYESVNDAARSNGFNLGSLSQLLHGKGGLKSVNGAVARFVDVDEVADENEEWRMVDNNMISNCGMVMSNRWGQKYAPRPLPEHGYCKAFGQYVHILVIRAFGPPKPSDEHTVDHINRIRNDNRIENLRWATRAEQMANRAVRKRRLNSDPSPGAVSDSEDWF
jgi:hypothetical protein